MEYKAQKAEEKATVGIANAASIINNSYKAELNNMYQDQQQDTTSLEQGISLTRTKPSDKTPINLEDYFNKIEEDALNNQNRLGMAGYSSIILIIAITIVAGMYLAIKIWP